jgi:hypothetical protein
MNFCKYGLLLCAAIAGSQTAQSAGYNLPDRIKQDLADTLRETGLVAPTEELAKDFPSVAQAIGVTFQDLDDAGIGSVKDVMVRTSETTLRIDSLLSTVKNRIQRNQKNYEADANMNVHWIGNLIEEIHGLRILIEATSTVILGMMRPDKDIAYSLDEIESRSDLLKTRTRAPELPDYRYPAHGHRSEAPAPNANPEPPEPSANSD